MASSSNGGNGKSRDGLLGLGAPVPVPAPASRSPVAGIEPISLSSLSPLPAGPLSAPSAASSVRTTVLPRRVGPNARAQMVARPRFERIGPLGEGGIGEVVLVHDHDISRRVAVKRLRGDRAGAEALIRFAEEIRVVGQLEHPGIVPVHDVGIDENGQHFLVMKYVEGDTIEQVIQKLRDNDAATTKRFTINYRTQIFASILEAVSYAHDRGIIHRDLKPSNIMVGPHGEVTIMDWGIAKHIGDQSEPARDDALASTCQDRLIQTQHGVLVGTPLYMSPEQAAGRNAELDGRSDIFSLGLVFFELLTLHHPLEDKPGTSEVLAELIANGVDPKNLQSVLQRSPVPVELRYLIGRALQHQRADRYPSVNEMLAQLRKIQDGDISVQCHITAFKRFAHGAIHWVDRNPGPYSLIFAALTLAALAGLGYGVFRLVHALLT